MILNRFYCRGIACFDEVELDFSDLPEGVIAIQGPNGAGKTALLGLFGAAPFYRKIPAWDPSALTQLVHASGGLLDLDCEIEGKGAYRVEQAYASEHGGKDLATLSHEGRPLNDGGVRSFGQQVLKLVGPEAAFMAGQFSAQGGLGRFGGLDDNARKAVFRYFLDLDRPERAREIVKKLAEKLDRPEIIRVAKDAPAARRAIAPLKMAIEQLQGLVVTATSAEEKARLEVERLLALDSSIALRDEYFSAGRDYVSHRDRALDLKAALEKLPKAVEIDFEKLSADLEVLETQKEQRRELAGAVDVVRQENRTATDALNRAEKAAKLLTGVPCGGEGQYVSCQFLVEAGKAKREIPALRAALNDTSLRLAAEGASLGKLPDSGVIDDRIDAIEAQIKAATPDPRRQRIETDLLAAEARRDEAKARAIALRSKLPKGFEALPSPETLKEARAASQKARSRLNDAHAALSEGKERLVAAERLRDQLNQKEAEIKHLIARADAIDLLTYALGKNGIQAMAIDAAGPEVSALANSLIKVCFGARFRIELRTQRELKSGRGTADDFDMVVHDAEKCRSGPFGSYCGGEKVILDESFGTALSIFSMSRRGIPWRTMWRDEPMAQLRGVNQARYVQMLCRARELGGFKHIFFVATDEMAALDCVTARIVVSEDSKVRLER